MALYGLKLLGAAFWSLLADQLHGLWYKLMKEDPDIWLWSVVKKNGCQYYKYVLCYVDDILCVPANLMDMMNVTRNQFKLKDDIVAETEDYLGA